MALVAPWQHHDVAVSCGVTSGFQWLCCFL